LRANRDTLGIPDACVTHIWTQERAVSEHVALASRIEHVVDELEDLVGAVDAVLLARDDPENHVAMARPFIESGIPIFIDKPLAYSWDDLAYFSDRVSAGCFVMSCSALRYSSGVQSARVEIPGLGRLELAVAVGKKDLRKYAIHYLEGLFSLLGDPTPVCVRHVGSTGKDTLMIDFADGLVATVHVFQDIAPGGELNVYGRDGHLSVSHGGAYPSFRASLVEAIRSFREGAPRLPFATTRNVIGALIAARESLEHGGRPVRLTL
jgi:predicted dehydrogenase